MSAIRLVKFLVAACVLVASAGTVAAATPRRVESPVSSMEVFLNVAAKQVCSDHFITGLEVDDIIQRSVLGGEWDGTLPSIKSEYYPFTEERLLAALKNIDVDEKKRRVTLASGPYVAKARYYGDQGCVILNPLTDDAFFEPVRVPRAAPADDVFPESGDLLSAGGALPAGYDRALLEEAVAEALRPDRHGAAFLVVHKGRVVIERYGQGIDRDTPTLNWSMGKSILAALIGRLEQLGELSLDDPAPVDAWRVHEGDPRAEIRIIDLMRMSAGLSCTRNQKPWKVRGVADDHNIIYQAPVDVIQNAITSPYAHAPNASWQYNNCDMQALGYIIRKKVAERGEDYLTWPYVELYNRIGMTGMVSEVDTYGNFHLTGYDYGTARDWVRYGLLHLNDGAWNGEQIVSKSFIEAARAPGPVWSTGEFADASKYKTTYGATHWLNNRGRYSLPRDAYFPLGFAGNYAFISPGSELVVVMLRLTSNEHRPAFTEEVLKRLSPGLGLEID